MKILFASDIHGDVSALRYLVDKCLDEKFDRFVITGDLTGFFGHSVVGVIEPVRDIVSLSVGNCDSKAVLNACKILCFEDYGVMYADGFNVFYTHGHVFGESKPPSGMKVGDVLVCGHTHIPQLSFSNGFLYANPGSASKPRGGFVPTYMTYDSGLFEITDFKGNAIISYEKGI